MLLALGVGFDHFTLDGKYRQAAEREVSLLMHRM